MAQGVKPVDLGVTVGQVFLGKYRVDAILGHGGMGVVAKCTHLALNEQVAIKMLRPDVLLDQDAVERFQREARAAAKLKSEYVAKVSDVGQFENGVPYMVMEFLEGLDLGDLLAERGTLPMPWAVELVLQAAEALAEAHWCGFVHRDVKPTNLFVTWRPDGTALIKVLDFGISKAPMGTDMQLTQTQSLLGTPAYMSPEQMRSARLVDSRTDIWSLGTVLYEVLEGHKPFEAESFSEMCVKVAVDAPLAMVRTPPALQAVVFRCLAKTPEQRYPSMAELGRDLIPFAQDPHQAQVMVERMTRLLGQRAIGEFAETSGGLRVPQAARDIGSGPSRGRAGSQPAAAAAAPSMAAAHPLTQPGVKTEVTRRRWPLIIGATLAAAIGITAVVVASSTDDHNSPPAKSTDDIHAGPATTVPTTTPPTVAAPVGNDHAPLASGQAGSSGSSTHPQDIANVPPATNVPPTTGGSAQTGSAQTNVEPARTGSEPPIKKASNPNSVRSKAAGKASVATPPIKKPEESKAPTATVPPPKPDCDPYSTFDGRGCPDKPQ